MRIRLSLAILIGKWLYFLSSPSIRHRGWPGRISRFIYPAVLEALTRRLVVNVVSGSTGAQTTGVLIAQGLRSQGLDCLLNPADQDSLDQVITQLLTKKKETHAVLVTRLTDVADVIRATRPDVLTLTTLSIDESLDRGMIGNVRENINLAITEVEPTLVLSSDDPLVSSLNADNRKGDDELPADEQAFFYAESRHRLTPVTESALKSPYRATHCPLCSRELVYEAIGTGGVGIYLCSNCGFRNPPVDLYYHMQDDWLTIQWNRRGLAPGSASLRRETRFRMRGKYAARYAAAALGTLHRLLPAAGIHDLQDTTTAYQPLFNHRSYRSETGQLLQLHLVSELHTLTERLDLVNYDDSCQVTVIWLSHPRGRSHDYSWIWDLDVNQVSFPAGSQVILTGDDAPLLWLTFLQQDYDMRQMDLITETNELYVHLRLLTEQAAQDATIYLYTNVDARSSVELFLEQMDYEAVDGSKKRG